MNNCGCWIIVVVLNLVIGGWSVRYLVEVLLHKNIDWLWACLIGLVGGELTVPAAIVVFFLRLAGVIP